MLGDKIAIIIALIIGVTVNGIAVVYSITSKMERVTEFNLEARPNTIKLSVIDGLNASRKSTFSDTPASESK
jgi:hypothetical protein